jgi:serine/threonine protein kinase
LTSLNLDAALFEEIVTLVVGESDVDRGPLPDDEQERYCVVIERPDLTLSGVVRGMLGNHDCQNDRSVRHRYTVKVLSVLRTIAKSLQRLHSEGFIHGGLTLENCGKYNDKWKLCEILGSQTIGRKIDASRLSSSAPPEAVLPFMSEDGAVHDAAFRTDLVAQPSVDSWAFGKVMYEVLVGDSLIEWNVATSVDEDRDSLARLHQWNEFNLLDCRRQLELVGVVEPVIELVLQCLCPQVANRLSMDAILKHSAWSELRRG